MGTLEPQRQKWDDYYSDNPEIGDDTWLESYQGIFTDRGQRDVLDLGCGNGANFHFLLRHDARISACDYSSSAIESAKKSYGIPAREVDMRQGLPYADHSFDIVLSDLSLHYFDTVTTDVILKEVARILRPGGELLARVNSTNDKEHGAGAGDEIEPNFFFTKNQYKRFFDSQAIDRYLGCHFALESKTEKTTYKYRTKKIVWEIVARKYKVP